MSRKLGREKKPAFDNFSRDLGVNAFFASEVGGERRDQLSEARHRCSQAASAGWASLWGPPLGFPSAARARGRAPELALISLKIISRTAFLVLHKQSVMEPGPRW